MNRTAHIRAFATIAAAVFVGGLWFGGVPPKAEWLRYFSIGVFTASALAWAWDRRLWRAKACQRLVPNPPVVRGTWKGVVRSNWDHGDHGASSDIEAYLAVQQTSSHLSVRLLTEESESISLNASVSRDGGLNYLYRNEPRMEAPDGSHIHRGAVMLNLSGMPVSALRGRYWTDRDTKGSLTFDQRKSAVADDYEAAQGLFAE